MIAIDDFVSSKAKLRIASLISTRPRTLGELAELTGISVQGVLKHLDGLRRSGLLTEAELRNGTYLKYRKIYSIEKRMVVDLSQEDLMVARVSRHSGPEEVRVRASYEELEAMAEDLIIVKRRIRDVIRRLKRLIEELTYSRETLTKLTGSVGLTKEEELIARILFTEDGLEETKRVLSRYYGPKDVDGSLRNVLGKIRGQ